MTFQEASRVVLPYPKYKGKTIDEVAQSNEGLLYLDWLAAQPWLFADIKKALDAYLGDEAVARDLSTILDDRAGWHDGRMGTDG